MTDPFEGKDVFGDETLERELRRDLIGRTIVNALAKDGKVGLVLDTGQKVEFHVGEDGFKWQASDPS